MGKPPDNKGLNKYNKYLTSYKCVKTSLKSIVKDKSTILILNKMVCNVNKIVIHTYNFLKMYCIHHFFENGSLPIIDKNLIVYIMKTVSKPDKEKPFKGDNLIKKNKLEVFYDKYYESTIMENFKLSGVNLTQVFEYESTSILTGFSNHIQEHFKDLLNRYINILVDFDKLKENNSNTSINRRLNKVKSDIFYNKSNADSVYDPIKELFKTRIIKDFEITNSLCFMAASNKAKKPELQSKTFQLLILLIRMSIDGEKIMKSRQDKSKLNDLFNVINCFPSRQNIRPKYIGIDSSIIIHNLMTENKDRQFYKNDGNMLKLSDDIWDMFFKTDKNVFKKHGYKFNRRIITDGIGCTITFVREDLYDPLKKTKVSCVKKPANYRSDLYIDELPENQLIKMRSKKLIGIDPGKSDLIFCTDGDIKTIKKDNGKVYRKTNTFTYSNGQRKKETKSKIYTDKLENDKKETLIYGETVKKYESMLSNYNSSSCIWSNVVKYMNIKNYINYLLQSYYEKELYRKLNWYSFINKQKSESNMINNFRKKYGSPKNTVILMGDFSQKHQMKFCEPTKGKSIRKLFKDAGYQLNLVQEYNTSKRLFNSGEELANFKWDKKRNKYVHRLLGSSILKSRDNEKKAIYKPLMDDLLDCGYRPTIINRDLNGSLNIRNRGWHVINGLEIPYYLKYQQKTDKKVKKIENELIMTINNLPNTSIKNKILKNKSVLNVTKKPEIFKVAKKQKTVKVTKNKSVKVTIKYLL